MLRISAKSIFDYGLLIADCGSKSRRMVTGVKIFRKVGDFPKVGRHKIETTFLKFDKGPPFRVKTQKQLE